MKRKILILTTVFALLISVPSAKAFWFYDADQRTYWHYAYRGFAVEIYDRLVFSMLVGKIGNINMSCGLIFYDPLNDNAVQWVVFESSSLWGRSLNGRWNGPGSTFYAVVNNNNFYTTYLYQAQSDAPTISLLSAITTAPPSEASGMAIDASALRRHDSVGAPLLFYMHTSWGDTFAIYRGGDMYLYTWANRIQFFPLSVSHEHGNSEGFLFYQPNYNAIKIVVFGVKYQTYAYTIEGHFQGFGQSLAYATQAGSQGYVTLDSGQANKNISYSPSPVCPQCAAAVQGKATTP